MLSSGNSGLTERNPSSSKQPLGHEMQGSLKEENSSNVLVNSQITGKTSVNHDLSDSDSEENKAGIEAIDRKNLANK